ncbi:MAG: hypothetical protein J6Y09_09565 [Lachnospiraceae bacterium]|nr:hypothetical protein [Lachnospiraceae bacterium]
MGPYTSEKIIHDFEKNELCLYMTDAWVEENGIQNPAIYDCFPKFLKDSIKGYGDTLPNTIRRMTGQSADRFMLKDRGYVKPGFFADFTVFDEEELLISPFDRTESFGIKDVIVNGEVVMLNKEIDYKAFNSAGRALKVL